jgi:ATP-dependent RNA helicase DeaD
LHGGMDQRQRDRVMGRVRDGSADLLVATDVAARGLDIERLSHVINYDMPASSEAYVHRIGRTGRAGREGTAITLVEPREHRLLRSMEAVTKQKVEVLTVPSVADLRARRLELTRNAVREQLVAGGFEHVRVVVETLAQEFDIVDVAAAALQLAHKAQGGDGDDREIPAPPVRGLGGPGPGAARDERERPLRPARGRVPGERPDSEGMTRIFIGAGRKAGVRPGDLVGAITGESGITSREIGAIEIADAFALVELPEERADQVIAALRKTKIRGLKPTVRREK